MLTFISLKTYKQQEVSRTIIKGGKIQFKKYETS